MPKSGTTTRGYPRRKYLRKARIEEGSDYLFALSRAYVFVMDQIKNRNYYAACLIESSLLEYSVKFLLWLDIIDKRTDSDETEKMDQLTERVHEASFGGNTKLAYEMGLISKRTKLSLDRFRETRNDLIHEAFFFGIKAKSAQKFVSEGHRIMDYLAEKIRPLMKRF